MQRLRYRHPSLVLVGVASSFAVVGCGYMVGSPNLPEVRSVYVPIFTSESNRRGLEYLLTEAVQKEIKLRTTMRLQRDANADTILKTISVMSFTSSLLNFSWF